MPLADKTTIPKREDIETKYTWNLSDIYPSDAAWESAYQSVIEKIKAAGGFAGRLADSSKTLFECLELRTEVGLLISRLAQYANLSRDLDNRVSQYQGMADRVAMLGAQASAAFAYIEPELLQIDEDELLEMEGEFEKQDIYDFYIRELIRSKAHIRSREVEELLAEASMIARGPDTVFTMLDDADLTYPAITDEKGNEVRLTKQRFAKFMESREQRVRKDASSAFYSSYKAHLNTIGANLTASVNGDVFYSKARHYESCLHNALDGNNIPVSVYHSLLETTEAHIDALHAYTALRKKVLKLDTIWPYDMMCPLFPDYDYEVGYDDAVAQVLEAIKPLGGEYRKLLEGAFDSRWVDVFETEGKGSGAYSYGNYSVHPYVLMNYNDTVDHMFTLAHEMGHAMHSTLTNRTQPFPKSQYSIFVAEVASTLNEGLLLNFLVNKATDKMARLYLLDRSLSNTMGTFFNQVMYARFELEIHSIVEKGNALTPEIMSTMWADQTQKYFGPALKLDEFSPLKWSRIPHFYTMYYVYQYATSYAASNAILVKFLNGETGIVKKYLELLSSGGRDHPIELLKICGVDMSRPEPTLATIQMFRDQIAEVEKLI
jgi:oligoendopeptidase F